MSERYIKVLTASGYEWTRSFFEKAALKTGRASSKLTTVESMMAGALAGSATVLMTNPIWVVNTRMTTRKSEASDESLPGAPTPAQKAPSTLGTLFALVRDEGPARLFAGVMPALVLVINPILQYTVFEQLKQMLEKRRRVTPKDAFYLGALGKLLATSITYPYITVKSRMHVAGRDGPREDMLTTFRRIIREEGYTGLYGGMWRTSWKRRANVLTNARYRTQGHPECHHRRLPLRFQGRPLRLHDPGTQEACHAQGLGRTSNWYISEMAGVAVAAVYRVKSPPVKEDRHNGGRWRITLSYEHLLEHCYHGAWRDHEAEKCIYPEFHASLLLNWNGSFPLSDLAMLSKDKADSIPSLRFSRHQAL